MPLTIPSLDDRRYQDLLDEALARIPVHTPEWTNFNKSDPGVTLIEVFAFLTENLLYRANQIPERNRRKFLTLLGVPLQPATAARGLVTFANERGAATTITLTRDLELLAGQVPFRTERGLDVLPVEARVYYKRNVTIPDEAIKEYYRQLYASFLSQSTRNPDQLELYETVPLDEPGAQGINLADTVGHALWVALLMRPNDLRLYPTPAQSRDAIREILKGKTLSLGIVPIIAEADRRIAPSGERPSDETLLRFELPSLPASGGLPLSLSDRKPTYQALEARATTDVLTYPGIVDLTLPTDPKQLALWNNIDPLEAGVGDLPPTLEDTGLEERVLTWLRVRPSGQDSAASVKAQILWMGINATTVQQRAHVSNELLPGGTGEPDQTIVLAHRPVLSGSVRLFITVDGKTEEWQEIEDILTAAPEVPIGDVRQPPGVLPTKPRIPQINVYTLDPESGAIRFGDGLHGRRPPLAAVIRADYDYSESREGNVGAGSINTSPALPAGLQVSNPIRTWGGAEAETVNEGERQITNYLQHRDRLVTANDFATITQRTPGVDIARVEVIPTFNPELIPNDPGDAPGAVTIMVIPRYDPVTPDAPRPDRIFLDQICTYLSPRRLVTTEIFVRGPKYKPIWVSVGIRVAPEFNAAEIRERVRQVVRRYLSPQPTPDTVIPGAVPPRHSQEGWPLSTSLVALEVLTEIARIDGVLAVTGVQIAEDNNLPRPSIDFRGLELPELKGVAVSIGDPLDIGLLRGDVATSIGQTPISQSVSVPVPFIPEECR